MLQRIQRIADHLKKTTGFAPETGIILGTGLSGLGKEIEVKHAIAYKDIPEFPVSTVEGHPGKLLFGYSAANPWWPCRAASISMRVGTWAMWYCRCVCSNSSASSGSSSATPAGA
jgi:hypothetical protein